MTDFAHTHTTSDVTDLPAIVSDVEVNGVSVVNDGVAEITETDENVKQVAPNPSSYSYWRSLLVGDASSGTEGFSPTNKTANAYAFNTLEAQPSTGSIRMGTASFYKGSYTSKLSPITLTANRTITIPNKSGTMALTSDISESLYIVKVGYDSGEDEYYLTDATFTDICDAYDSGMALILIYVDEDDYAFEYVLSNYAPDDDFISFSSSFAPETVDTFTINSDDSVDYLQSTARTSALINDSLFVRGNSAVWEGTCSTVAGTSAKYVNCASFTADDQDVGTIVFVTFDETNSATPSGLTLNVQNRGAKPIKRLVAGQVADLASASDLTGTMPFFYDGTNWVTWYDTSGSGGADQMIWSGTCATAAATGAKEATVTGFTSADLKTGTIVLVSFDNANSAAVGDLTLNVSGTGAYGIKQNKAGTIGNFDDKSYLKANTYPFIFNGTYWVSWYNTDTNTIGYNIRTNAMSLPMKNDMYRYRIAFMSADDCYYVSSNASSSTSATAKKTVTGEKINPHGRIVYYATTAAVTAGNRPSVSYMYSQYYTITLGYSFNRTGAALTMTAWKPVYIKCSPQTDGSAIIDPDTPFVQAQPTTNDGYIYIFLGVATSATAIEMTLEHPVYYHDGTALRRWTGPVTP